MTEEGMSEQDVRDKETGREKHTNQKMSDVTGESVTRGKKLKYWLDEGSLCKVGCNIKHVDVALASPVFDHNIFDQASTHGSEVLNNGTDIGHLLDVFDAHQLMPFQTTHLRHHIILKYASCHQINKT